MSWDLDLNPMQFQWGNRLQGLRQEFRFSGEIVGHHHVTCSVAIIKSNFICFSELSRVVPWSLNQAAIMPKVPYDKIRWSHDDISAKSLPGSSWLLFPGTHSTIIRVVTCVIRVRSFKSSLTCQNDVTSVQIPPAPLHVVAEDHERRVAVFFPETFSLDDELSADGFDGCRFTWNDPLPWRKRKNLPTWPDRSAAPDIARSRSCARERRRWRSSCEWPSFARVGRRQTAAVRAATEILGSADRAVRKSRSSASGRCCSGSLFQYKNRSTILLVGNSCSHLKTESIDEQRRSSVGQQSDRAAASQIATRWRCSRIRETSSWPPTSGDRQSIGRTRRPLICEWKTRFAELALANAQPNIQRICCPFDRCRSKRPRGAGKLTRSKRPIHIWRLLCRCFQTGKLHSSQQVVHWTTTSCQTRWRWQQMFCGLKRFLLNHKVAASCTFADSK